MVRVENVYVCNTIILYGQKELYWRCVLASERACTRRAYRLRCVSNVRGYVTIFSLKIETYGRSIRNRCGLSERHSIFLSASIARKSKTFVVFVGVLQYRTGVPTTHRRNRGGGHDNGLQCDHAPGD